MVNARLTKLGLRFATGGAAALLAARVEAVPVSVSMGVHPAGSRVRVRQPGLRGSDRRQGDDSLAPRIGGMGDRGLPPDLALDDVHDSRGSAGNLFDPEWFDDSLVRLAAPSDTRLVLGSSGWGDLSSTGRFHVAAIPAIGCRGDVIPGRTQPLGDGRSAGRLEGARPRAGLGSLDIRICLFDISA